MNEVKQLKQLYTFDRWANHKVIDILQNKSVDEFSKCLQLLAHISAAQQIWYRRIRGLSSADIDLWPTNYSVDNSSEILNDLHPKWLTMLKEKARKLHEDVSYKNSKRKEFSTALAGILHHVIIHGQHHRAQVSTLLRQSGIEPPATDFIFYLRETNNQ
jgi:uncharacterized damage-inducible protein DinB